MNGNTPSPSTLSFVWENEMEKDCSLPATDPALFSHVDFAQKFLAEIIYRPGHIITVRLPDGNLVKTKVEVSCDTVVLANIHNKLEWISVGSVVANNERKVKPEHALNDGANKNSLKDLCEGTSAFAEESSFPVDEAGLAFLTPSSIVKAGQYMELQDSQDPRVVHVVKVVENRGGLLSLEKPDLKCEWVFMTSERCHPVRWGISGKQQVTYDDDSLKLLCKASSNAVASYAFSPTFEVKEHKFEVGMMLEVLDTTNECTFYPGYVSEIINNHYFRVHISKYLTGPAKEIICHRSHPQIFPIYWCQNHSLRLTPPGDYDPEPFSWNVYRSKCGLTNGSAPDSYFDTHRRPRRNEKLRNLGVLVAKVLMDKHCCCFYRYFTEFFVDLYHQKYINHCYVFKKSSDWGRSEEIEISYNNSRIIRDLIQKCIHNM
ncbi:hypothetical protein AB6A40_001724 [Gnathostoma spinigerum]|uniref:Uncharacterized protein n=1 Tax=Gnathostoma spinigerum TaxID=75299 RepID=A0ABD6EFA9_9BILA